MKISVEETLSYLKRLLKGLILFGWIYLLISASLYTSTNSFAGKVFDIFDINHTHSLSADQNTSPNPVSNSIVSKVFSLFDNNHMHSTTEDHASKRVLPYSELRSYLVASDDQAPPIEDVLNELFPTWANVEISPPLALKQNNNFEQTLWAKEQYRQLFKRIDDKLITIAKTTTDIKNVNLIFSDLVPSTFIRPEDDLAKEISIPDSGIIWINSEKERFQLRQDRTPVIDLFVILMVLGAFGSLIFLTRDYMLSETDDSATLGSYIFRPILGMFLAVAMYIVDIAAHTLISSSGLNSVRNETLYLLAFAAGLLSEQTYSLVYMRGAEVLKSMEKKKEVEEAMKAKQQARVNELPK